MLFLVSWDPPALSVILLGKMNQGDITPTYTPVPEWLRVPEACRLTGLSRSTLYELISARAIKSSAVRRRGKRRGVRLIHRASLLALIESHIE